MVRSQQSSAEFGQFMKGATQSVLTRLNPFSSSPDDDDEQEDADSTQELEMESSEEEEEEEPQAAQPFDLDIFSPESSSELPPDDLFKESSDADALWYSPQSALSDVQFPEFFIKGLSGPENEQVLERLATERSFDDSPIFNQLYQDFGYERAVILFSTYGLRRLAQASSAYSRQARGLSLQGRDDGSKVTVLPPELFGMSSLLSLTIKGMSLREFSLDASVPNKLGALTRLDLRDNELRLLEQHALLLPRLEVLILSNNDLVFGEADEDLFVNTPSLQIIRLSHNRRVTRLPRSLTGLPQLKDLYLDRTGINALPATAQWASNPVIDITETPLSKQANPAVPFGMLHSLVLPDDASVVRHFRLGGGTKRARINESLAQSTSSSRNMISWPRGTMPRYADPLLEEDSLSDVSIQSDVEDDEDEETYNYAPPRMGVALIGKRRGRSMRRRQRRQRRSVKKGQRRDRKSLKRGQKRERKATKRGQKGELKSLRKTQKTERRAARAGGASETDVQRMKFSQKQSRKQLRGSQKSERKQLKAGQKATRAGVRKEQKGVRKDLKRQQKADRRARFGGGGGGQSFSAAPPPPVEDDEEFVSDESEIDDVPVQDLGDPISGRGGTSRKKQLKGQLSGVKQEKAALKKSFRAQRSQAKQQFKQQKQQLKQRRKPLRRELSQIRRSKSPERAAIKKQERQARRQVRRTGRAQRKQQKAATRAELAALRAEQQQALQQTFVPGAAPGVDRKVLKREQKEARRAIRSEGRAQRKLQKQATKTELEALRQQQKLRRAQQTADLKRSALVPTDVLTEADVGAAGFVEDDSDPDFLQASGDVPLSQFTDPLQQPAPPGYSWVQLQNGEYRIARVVQPEEFGPGEAIAAMLSYQKSRSMRAHSSRRRRG